MPLSSIKDPVERYFAFMQERESIRKKKLAGEVWPNLTEEPVLRDNKFTNVKREHDKTSQLFIQKLYKPNYNAPREQLLLNCVLARYFGTIEFMETIGWQRRYLPEHLKAVARKRLEEGKKVFTAAYIIPSGGMAGPKEQITVDHFITPLWKGRKRLCEPQWEEWQAFIAELQTFMGFGGTGFMAKEVTLDLRYTSFWPKPPKDVNTWTPVGPGSKRGAARVRGDINAKPLTPEATLEVCLELFAKRKQYLPKDFVELELHDIQFQLCEFDKFERVSRGQGQTRSKYRPMRHGLLG